jgi:hypothetical protein
MKSLLRLGLVALGLLMATQAEAANRFAICSTTCNWNTTASWSTTSGGGTGASVPSTSDNATFDASTCVGGTTCTMTIDAPVTIVTLTMSACTATTTGCIIDNSVNNEPFTLSGVLTSTGSGTRTLKCGSATWKFTGSNTPVNWAGATNFTDTCSSAIFSFQPTSITTVVAISPQTSDTGFPTVDLEAPSAGGQAYPFQISISTAATIAGLTMVNSPQLVLTSSTTLTITNAPALTGTLAAPVTILANTPSSGTQTTVNITTGTFTCSYCAFGGINLGVSTSFANSWNLYRNTNVNVTAPSGGGGGGACITGD